MTITHQTITFDVDDCVVFPLTTDSGASPTYGTGVDVPGIANVAANPAIISQQLKGDRKIMDRRSKLDEFTFSATYGKLDLDVLAVIMGTTVVDGGGGPNETASTTVQGGGDIPYFGVVVQMNDVETGLGSLRFYAWKAKITAGTVLTGAVDAYGQPTFDAGCIATESTTDIVKFETREDEEDIPTGAFPA